jgi:hypothetical protein
VDNTNLILAQVAGLFRGLLWSLFSAYGVSAYINQDQTGAIVSLVLLLIPAVWTWWRNRRIAAHLERAADAPSGSTVPKVPL